MTVPTANKPHPQYRIAHLPLSGNANIDVTWDKDAEKYKILFRSVHVTKASQYISIAQLIITAMVFSVVLYGIASRPESFQETRINGVDSDGLIGYVLGLQFSCAPSMMYGIRSERRIYLLPFIIFSVFVVFLGLLQMMSDVIRATQQRADASPLGQILSYLVGLFIHMWCVTVIWRCYCYFGDKEVAEQIRENLHTTAPFVCDYAQPPPYENTVIEKKAQLSVA